MWEEEFTLHLYNIIHEINRANNKQPTNNKGSYKITWCCFIFLLLLLLLLLLIQTMGCKNKNNIFISFRAFNVCLLLLCFYFLWSIFLLINNKYTHCYGLLRYKNSWFHDRYLFLIPIESFLFVGLYHLVWIPQKKKMKCMYMKNKL